MLLRLVLRLTMALQLGESQTILLAGVSLMTLEIKPQAGETLPPIPSSLVGESQSNYHRQVTAVPVGMTAVDMEVKVPFSPSQVQSLCKTVGETKRVLWLPLVTQAGRMMKKEEECGTAQAPREAGHRGDRGATAGGIRAMLGRSPATRWVTGFRGPEDG